MDEQIKIDHVGGWPKILLENPERPHDLLGFEEFDDSDVPHDIELAEARSFRETKYIYSAFTVITEFHKLQLYPPKWALDRLVEGLNKHLANPDPEEFARQMSVSGRTSGAMNPHKEYCIDRDRDVALADVVILAGYFGLSFTDAARAAVEKHELGITTKRLMNMLAISIGTPRNSYE